MANPGRIPGKKGALPRDKSKYMPTVEHYLRPWEGPLAGNVSVASPLPPEPGDVDRASLVTDWPVYLNDQIGDCTVAAIEHAFSAMRVYAGFPLPLFSDQATEAAYSAVSGYVPGDPSTDNGADPSTVLSYMRSHGITDELGYTHRVAGYAAFGNPQNFSLMAQVLAATGTVYIAIDCPQSMEDDFANGTPITYVPGSPSLGGHMIDLQRRSVGGVGVLQPVTWGELVRMTRRFLWHQVQDVFMVVSEDYVNAGGTTIQGFDLAQLLDDMTDVE